MLERQRDFRKKVEAAEAPVRNGVEGGMPLGAVAKQRGLKGTLPIREKPAQCAGFDAESEGS